MWSTIQIVFHNKQLVKNFQINVKVLPLDNVKKNTKLKAYI